MFAAYIRESFGAVSNRARSVNANNCTTPRDKMCKKTVKTTSLYGVNV